MELTGVGTFRDPQVVEFDPLTDSGLFLIDGPTGSGKTTLIDAITFALYGTVAGRESDPARLRSAYCSADDPTEVILDFSVHGRRHRIARSPEYTRAAKRKTESGIATQRAKQNLIEFDAAGGEVVHLTSAQDIGIHIQQLLGMDADQFRQLVVLPQGEFADLLRMSPRARLAALESLLGSAFFTQVQDQLLRRAEEARAQQRAADDRVHTLTQTIVSRIGELSDLSLDMPMEILSAALSSDEERRAALHQIQHALGEGVIETAAVAQQAKIDRDAAQVEMAEAGRLAESLAALAQARAGLKSALAELGVSALDVESARAQEREFLGFVGKLGVFADWEAEEAVRAEQRASYEANREDRLRALADLEEMALVLPQRVADLERQVLAAEQLVARLPELQAQASEVASLAAAIANIGGLASHELVLTKDRDDALSALVAAQRVVGELEAELEALQTAQLAQRASQMAHSLTPGAPCPVCGATEHPNPAAGDRGQLVEVQTIETARAGLMRARSTQTQAEERRDQADSALRAHQTKLAELSGRVGSATQDDVSGRLTELHEQISQAQAMDVPALRAELFELIQLRTTIAADEKAAREQLTAAQSALGALDVAEGAKRREIVEIVGEHSSATHARAAVEVKLAALGRALVALEEQSAAAAGLSDLQMLLDPEEVVTHLRRVTDTHTQAVRRAEQATDRAAIMANAAGALAQLADEFTTALNERQVIAAGAEVPVMVADIATARSPANQRRLSLASYAVQLRFAHVLESASLHLERMSAGQYAFQLSESSRGREQAGLGIDVVDSWTGQARDPRSLSGGETFYAALSLALGLADVVQSETGGAQLDTLFVDEGFGSLDQDTLQLVLDQLDQLRSGGRVVGVISHVTEMKERIPDRIQVHVLPDHTSVISQIPANSV